MKQDYPDKLKSFKESVMSKIVREVDNCKDIKITIHTTLNEFLHEKNITGWVCNSDENDILLLSKDNNALYKEIASLNKQIQKLQEQLNAKSKEQFENYFFDELITLFINKKFPIPLSLIEDNTNKETTVNTLEFFIFILMHLLRESQIEELIPN